MITPVTRTVVERRCRICRCTDEEACWDGEHPCFWVTADLCSRCVRGLLTRELEQEVRDDDPGMDSGRGAVQPRRQGELLLPRAPEPSPRGTSSRADPMELLSLGRDPEDAA